MKKVCKKFLFLFLFFSQGLFAQSYTETQKTVPTDRNKVNHFGQAVALFGPYAAIAAPLQNDSSKIPVANAVGAVYLFEQDSSDNWIQVQKIRPTDAKAQDNFGHSLSLWKNVLMVGVPQHAFDDTSGNRQSLAGAVYCYVRSDSGRWNLAQKIVANDRRAGQSFGWDVALKGKRMMVGAYTDNRDAKRRNNLLAAGSAYFFEQDSSGMWVQSQKISASDRKANARFGYAVDFSGKHALVGAPWETTDTVGSSILRESGAVYFYGKDTSQSWTELHKITASDRAIDDQFGYDVGLFNDQLIVSSPFKRNISIGTDRAGKLYFLSYKNNVITETKSFYASDIVSNCRTYYGLSLDIENNRATVSSLSCLDSNGNTINGFQLLNAGAFEIYTKDSSGWNYSHSRVASDQAARDSFGVAVSMHRNMILVGAPHEDHDTCLLYTSPSPRD